jgi:adenosylcobinamide-GDP ribazoletransferase
VAGLAGAGAALLLATLVAGQRGARAVVAGWVSGALVLVLARRRIGGFTGDVLGAAGVVCETAGLVMAAAK